MLNMIIAVLLALPIFAKESTPHATEVKRVWKPLYPPKIMDSDKTTRPGRTEIIEPAWFASVTDSVLLKWKAADQADAYLFQVAEDANFKWLVKNEPLLKATEYNMSGLQTGKSYYWQVAGLKTSNDPGSLKGEFSKSMFVVK